MDSGMMRGVGELALVGLVALCVLVVVLILAAVGLPIMAICWGWHPSTLSLCCLPAVVLGWLLLGSKR